MVGRSEKSLLKISWGRPWLADGAPRRSRNTLAVQTRKQQATQISHITCTTVQETNEEKLELDTFPFIWLPRNGQMVGHAERSLCIRGADIADKTNKHKNVANCYLPGCCLVCFCFIIHRNTGGMHCTKVKQSVVPKWTQQTLHLLSSSDCLSFFFPLIPSK